MIEHKDNHDGIFANTKALSLDEGYGTLPVSQKLSWLRPARARMPLRIRSPHLWNNVNTLGPLLKEECLKLERILMTRQTTKKIVQRLDAEDALY